MPNTTTNFKLIKPLVTDLYDIEVQNQNMDIIDAALKELESKVDTLVDFEEVEF